ncbi:class I SAM-dependent methyltransferase [Bradyrhizobium genosp. L]|uniref:class I SAM-dependent methyltransferase n=1 Tax=Bradyrhizobium genosp. L TaxID=83637 RepID=UPI0018A297FC|nr:class I SAM-dependent methyltransferase [Bradyrhizobium genosp. L]QPF82401.1 class I SAM-dependent methyltransferase [Bradyrhizobium genosp. L]
MSEWATDWRARNMAMWNRKVSDHIRSPVYDVPGFIAGRSSLRSHEIRDLGDIGAKHLVHLQCHIGLDTLSWARRGARVTGLDFSQTSIAAARRIAARCELDAEFVIADVYEAPRVLGRRFDIVYTGVGALCWLPDIARWAQVVRDLLKPGGELYLFEFHPVEWMLDWRAADRTELKFDYFTPCEGCVDRRAIDDAAIAPGTVQWNHPLGEVITALAAAGLNITELRELDRSVLKRRPEMEDAGLGMFRMRPGMPQLPLMYVLRARRP